VQLKYRLYQRGNRTFYWQDNASSKQGSPQTRDRRAADQLLAAMNEAYRQPTLNLNLARAYLAAHVHEPNSTLRASPNVKKAAPSDNCRDRSFRKILE
jgi:hypothetical protein